MHCGDPPDFGGLVLELFIFVTVKLPVGARRGARRLCRPRPLKILSAYVLIKLLSSSAALGGSGRFHSCREP